MICVGMEDPAALRTQTMPTLDHIYGVDRQIVYLLAQFKSDPRLKAYSGSGPTIFLK